MIDLRATHDSESDYIFAGHSHIFCMGAQQGYKGPISLVRSLDNESVSFLAEEWTGSRSKDYWAELVKYSNGRAVRLIFSGNQHHSEFLLPAQPLFDFVDPANPAPLQPGSVAVPRRLVKAHFYRSFGELTHILSQLEAAGCTSVAVLGTPPPKANLSPWLRQIRDSEFFRGVAKTKGLDISTIDMTPTIILLKMWRVLQELYEEIASSYGAKFVSVPNEALTIEGYLKEEYYADITHANAQYGQLMLQKAINLKD